MDVRETPESLLRLLGLARRAGTLQLGLDKLKICSGRKKHCRIYAGLELSERAQRELDHLAERNARWQVIRLSDFERLRLLLAKPGVSLVAILDPAWFKGLDDCWPGAAGKESS